MNKILLEEKNVINIDESNDYILEYNNNNINTIINIKPNINVSLKLIAINLELTNNVIINIEYNSTLNISIFYQNIMIDEDVTINLKEEGASIYYNFSSIATSNENYNMTINHLNKSTKSYISNKLIAQVEGKINFNIDSIIKNNNPKSIMEQATKIINIEDNNSLIKPNMYIDEHDVIAKHSSVIGTFKEEEIFYLTTRGIDEELAIKLLVKGYLLSNFNKDLYMKSNIINIINKYWR